MLKDMIWYLLDQRLTDSPLMVMYKVTYDIVTTCITAKHLFNFSKYQGIKTWPPVGLETDSNIQRLQVNIISHEYYHLHPHANISVLPAR